MSIWLQSNPPKKINLNKNDFTAEGGEGQVFLLNDLAIKLYKEPGKCIQKGKIDELAALEDPQIMRPLFLAKDDKGQAVGYAMKRLSNAIALCKLFTNDFRSRNDVTPEKTMRLVKEIENVLRKIHAANCLMVDVNDMNIMVPETDPFKPFFIDVDSYQTPTYPAAAIMPSVKDHQAQKLTPLSDWYSFSILAFQLIVGIHPFKGTHPDFKKSDLEGRMRKNISVFDRQVTLPRTTRELSLIPAEYRDWFEALYVQGRRLEPPGVIGPIVIAKPKTVTGGGALDITVTCALETSILGLLGDLVITRRGVFNLNGRKVIAGDGNDIYLLAPQTGELVSASIEKGMLKLSTPRQKLPFTLAAQDVIATEQHLYIRNAGQLTAVKIMEISSKTLATVGRSWSIMPHATNVYDGMAIQNTFGATWLVIPGDGTTPTCQIFHVPELDGTPICEATYKKGVAMILVGDQGKYDLNIIRISDNGTYQLEAEKDVDYHKPSFTVLDNGIVAHIRHDGKLALFHQGKGATNQITFEDPRINGGMHITSSGNKTYLIEDNRLCRLKTEPGQ